MFGLDILRRVKWTVFVFLLVTLSFQFPIELFVFYFRVLSYELSDLDRRLYTVVDRNEEDEDRIPLTINSQM